MDRIACVAMGYTYSPDIPQVPYNAAQPDSAGTPVHGNRNAARVAVGAEAASGVVGLALHMAAG